VKNHILIASYRSLYSTLGGRVGPKSLVGHIFLLLLFFNLFIYLFILIGLFISYNCNITLKKMIICFFTLVNYIYCFDSLRMYTQSKLSLKCIFIDKTSRICFKIYNIHTHIYIYTKYIHPHRETVCLGINNMNIMMSYIP